MAEQQPPKPDTGTLWQRPKKSDKSPDFGGKAYISDETLTELYNRRSRGETATLDVAGWKKYDNKNMAYLSLSLRPFDQRFESRTSNTAGSPNPPAWVESGTHPFNQGVQQQQFPAAQADDPFGNAPQAPAGVPGKRPW